MLVETSRQTFPMIPLLQAMLVEARGEITMLRTVSAEADAEIERLTGIIAALQRHRFGARSEQLSEDQLSLAFEETEAALARVAAKLESVTPGRGPKVRNTNRGRLPAHLERVEQIVDIDSKPVLSLPKGPAPAVAARCMSSARMSPSASMSCRPRSACW